MGRRLWPERSDRRIAVTESAPVSSVVTESSSATRAAAARRRPRAGQLEQRGPDAAVPLLVAGLPRRRAHVAEAEVGQRRGAQLGQLAVHVAGEGEERVPLPVAQPPDEVAAVAPRRRAGLGRLDPRPEGGRVRRRVPGVGRGHHDEQPRLGPRGRRSELVQRHHLAGVAVEVAAFREPLGQLLARAEVAAVGDHQMPVGAGRRDLGGLAPAPGPGRASRSGRGSCGRPPRGPGRRLPPAGCASTGTAAGFVVTTVFLRRSRRAPAAAGSRR